MTYLIFLEVNFIVKYDGGLLNIWVHMLMLTVKFNLSFISTLFRPLDIGDEIKHLVKNALL